MDVSSVSDSSVLDILAKASTTQSDQATKLAKINLELQMKAEELAMAQAAIGKFYA